MPVIFLAAGLVWLSPLLCEPDGVLLWRGGRYSDILISHLPNAVWLRESILRWHQVPLWNALILGGGPFAADPLSGIWYPPNWLAVGLPPTLAFNLLFWLHLSWGGFGLFRLLRAEGVGSAAAAFGGLLFSGTPKLVGHVGLGHLGLVCAVGWTPWCLLAVRKTMTDAVEGQGRAWSAASGGLVGLVFLADPRWVIACVGLMTGYGAACLAHSQRWHRETAGRLLSACGIALGMGAAVAASQALPLMEFSRLTRRAELSGAEQAALSLPAARVVGVLYPDLGGWPEWMVYVSVVGTGLALLAFVLRAPGRLFWGLAAVVGWLLAIGEATPLYPALSALVPLMRVPPRFLLVCAMAVCALSAWGLQRLLDALEGRRLIRRARLALVGFAGLVTALAAWFGLATGEVPPGLVGSALLTATAAAWGIWSGVRRVPARWIAIGWIVLGVLDVAWVDRSLLSVRPRPRALNERAALVQVLKTDRAGSRVFSPSYSVPQQSAALAGIELADGINPLQLSAYVDFMSRATGFNPDGYSVTLPPFRDGDPHRDWSPLLDAERLGLLAVEYIVSDFPLAAQGLTFEGQIEGVYVYGNPAARPRAWVEEATGPEASRRWRNVDGLEWSPNRIEIEAAGPGMLVLSEIAYPGWQARVDGKAAQLETCYDLLRCLLLPEPEGTHRVVLVFRPASVYAGLGLALAGLMALIWLWRRG